MRLRTGGARADSRPLDSGQGLGPLVLRLRSALVPSEARGRIEGRRPWSPGFALGAPHPYWHVGVIQTHEVLARRARLARTLSQRLAGLLKEEALPEGGGLILLACRAVHTWGMRFAIDVVFADRAWQVVALVSSMRPGRISPIIWRAAAAIELPAGTAVTHGVRIGDHLELRPADRTPGGA